MDLTGKLFGRLVPIERREGSAWLCQCDCGNTKTIKTNALTSGKTRSCGCLRKDLNRKSEEFIGKRFGQLLVLSEAKRPKNIKGTAAFWLCRCDCGNEKVIRGKNLKTGDTRSCGCLRFDRTAARLLEKPVKRKNYLEDRSEKKCPKCTTVKPILEFPKNSTSYDGYGGYCKPCHNRQVRETRKKNGTRKYFLKRRYGITQDDFDRMVETQEGLCAICKKPGGKKPWHVDHDHKTGKVRGILCHHCNTALGNFNDDLEVLQRALDYLKD